ncbi:hypothetical protein IU449_04675 [Nocardia higoensis]|uniref:Uncharacterized protein n=1 Tax=Nocardia higoensis TaxID=228599 RepID=A0ABS0DAF0_9NOCA|nr:hypothetical protein [Nocardia higoensis]MBF6353849.1 hypothetical protein [Nocardia higoensis]
MPQHRQLEYVDELLADGTVHRRYADGREEWRTRGPADHVSWRDSDGRTGTDEPLGPRLVKRTHRTGVLYGRECGYGRTLWSDGVLTVNRSSFGGRIGVVLAGIAGGALLGALVMPPSVLSPEEEEELRNQAARDSAGGSDSSGGDPADGGGTGDGGGYDDWDDGYGDGDDDFG